MLRSTSKLTRAVALPGLLALSVALLAYPGGVLADTTNPGSNAQPTPAPTTSGSTSVFKPAPPATSAKAPKRGSASDKPTEK
jgi:hypothetical protein